MSSDMIVTTTPMSVQESLDCVAQILDERGCPVVARFNLGESARRANLTMQVELLMFDYPNKWASLMRDDPAIGIEWPLKILAWQDEQGTTRVGYTKPKNVHRVPHVSAMSSTMTAVRSSTSPTRYMALTSFATFRSLCCLNWVSSGLKRSPPPTHVR